LTNDKPYLVGVDLGGTNVRAAAADANGKIIGDGRAPSLAMEGAMAERLHLRWKD